jgi:hypothetical protein
MASLTVEEAERFVKELGKVQRENWEKVDDLRGAIERLLKIWYSPHHILIELLQNADDEGDEENPNDCQFILSGDGIIFRHHGKSFETKNVEAISKINKTTKKPGIHIGYMGIGFKSVFNLTDSPYIFCEPFRFRFSREDVIVPRWVEETEIPEPVKGYLESGWTTFYLPLANSNLKHKGDVAETLLNIDPVILVFLKKTKTITVKTDSVTVRFIKEAEDKSSPLSGNSECRKLRLKIREVRNGDERFHNFLVYKARKPVEQSAIDKEAESSRKAELKEVIIMLVFTLDNRGDFDVEKRPLYTFLPTRYNPGLRFVVSSDFILDSSRGEPIWSSSWNVWLLRSVADILKMILEDFKRDEDLKRKFYKVLPRDDETNDPITEYVTKELVDYCLNSSVVLTSDEQWVKPSQCVIADEDLQGLVPPDRLDYQFYVNPRVEGKEFLVKQLNVREIKSDHERKILLDLLSDEPWLDQQDPAWYRSFYEFLYNRITGNKAWKISYWEHNDLLNELKQRPLIKTSRGLTKPVLAILPNPEGEITAISKLPYLEVVEPSLLTEKSTKLFEMLGVQELTDVKLVSSILTKCIEDKWVDWPNEVREHTLNYVKEWILKRTNDIPDQILNELPNIIVPIRGGGWDRVGNCYIPDEQLEELIPDIRVVDDKLTRDDDWARFLELAKVNRYPRIIHVKKLPIFEAPESISVDDWNKYIRSPSLNKVRRSYGKQESLTDVKFLEGFDEALRTSDEKKLKHYFEYLYTHWDDYYCKHLNSSYNWVTTSGYHHSENIESYFCYQLKNRWLPTNEGLKKPEEAFLPLKELKKVFGSLVPYVLLSENLLAKRSGFARAIGIHVDLGKDKLLLALKRAKMFEVNYELKRSLRSVYQYLALLAEGEQFDNIELLCEDGEFRKASENIYWNDEPEVANSFARPPPFVWDPELPRPQLEALFKAFKIRRLSESITRRIELVDSNVICEDTRFERKIQEKLTYLYSVFLDAKVDNAERIIESLKRLKVTRIKDLHYIASLEQETARIKASVFYDQENNILYLQEDSDPFDIAIEFVRVFRIHSTYAEQLRLVIEEGKNVIESRLKKGGITIVEYRGVQDVQLEQEMEIKESEGKKEEHVPELVVVDERKFDTREYVERSAEDLFERESQSVDLSDLSNPPPDVDVNKSVVSPKKLIVYESKKPYASLNLHPKQVDGITLLVAPDLPVPSVEKIKAFLTLLRKILACMEANPDIVMIIVSDRNTDARDLSPTYQGRIGFNATLIDSPPIFWMIVAARELAALRHKEHYPHVKAMSILIEKGIKRLHEIDPDFIKRIQLQMANDNHPKVHGLRL